MSIVLEKYASADRKALKKLYLSAFPAEERAPFFMIMSGAKKGRAEMLTARENGEFAGFAYVVCRDDLVYLFYLAVDGSRRGRGVGGEIIGCLREMYSGKRIFLAREQLDESADNYAQRVSRRDFYLRCGFQDTDMCIKEASVTYDVMGIGGDVEPAEYEELMRTWCGKLLYRLVDMRLFRKGQ